MWVKNICMLAAVLFLLKSGYSQEVEGELEMMEMDVDEMEYIGAEPPASALNSVSGNPSEFKELGDCVVLSARTSPRSYGRFVLGPSGIQQIYIPDTLSGFFPVALYQGDLYFSTNTQHLGTELWSYNFDTKQCRLVSEIAPGNEGGRIKEGVVFKDKLYFLAKPRSSGMELWMTDGSIEGTKKISQVSKYKDSQLKNLIVFNDHLYFHGTYKLYVSSGAENDVREVPIESDLKYLSIIDLCTSSKNLFLSVASSGKGIYVVTKDGVRTEKLKFWPEATGVRQIYPVSIADKIYFEIENKEAKTVTLWESNGKEKGTKPLVKNAPKFSSILHLNAKGQNLFFGGAVDGKTNLWAYRVDKKKLEILEETSAVTNTTPYGFTGNADATFFQLGFSPNTALWVTDGTPNGTKIIKHKAGKGNFSEAVFFNGSLYFNHTKPNSFEKELWRSDGTKEGTKFYHDF